MAPVIPDTKALLAGTTVTAESSGAGSETKLKVNDSDYFSNMSQVIIGAQLVCSSISVVCVLN